MVLAGAAFSLASNATDDLVIRTSATWKSAGGQDVACGSAESDADNLAKGDCQAHFESCTYIYSRVVAEGPLSGAYTGYCRYQAAYRGKGPLSDDGLVIRDSDTWESAGGEDSACGRAESQADELAKGDCLTESPFCKFIYSRVTDMSPISGAYTGTCKYQTAYRGFKTLSATAYAETCKDLVFNHAITKAKAAAVAAVQSKCGRFSTVSGACRSNPSVTVGDKDAKGGCIVTATLGE